MKNNEYIEISRDIENLLKSESTHTFLILIDILLRSNNETNSLKTSISKISRVVTIALLNMDVVGQMECLKDWQMKN